MRPDSLRACRLNHRPESRTPGSHGCRGHERWHRQDSGGCIPDRCGENRCLGLHVIERGAIRGRRRRTRNKDLRNAFRATIVDPLIQTDRTLDGCIGTVCRGLPSFSTERWPGTACSVRRIWIRTKRVSRVIPDSGECNIPNLTGSRYGSERLALAVWLVLLSTRRGLMRRHGSPV